MITEKILQQKEIDTLESMINITAEFFTELFKKINNNPEYDLAGSITDLVKIIKNNPKYYLNDNVLTVLLKGRQSYNKPLPIAEDAREALGEKLLGEERWRAWKEHHGVKTHTKRKRRKNEKRNT